jgi:hypothetical protein
VARWFAAPNVWHAKCLQQWYPHCCVSLTWDLTFGARKKIVEKRVHATGFIFHVPLPRKSVHGRGLVAFMGGDVGEYIQIDKSRKVASATWVLRASAQA